MKPAEASLALLVTVLALTTACVQSQTPPAGNETKAHTLIDNGSSVGPADARVVIVEFSDYQCPYCAAAEPSVKTILQEYAGKVRLVYRNFPIDSSCNTHVVRNLHPSACKAAQAAECARDQGLFWEYHDRLIEETLNATAEERAVNFDDFSLKKYAAQLGLDAPAFSACLDSGMKLPRIQEDIKDAVNASIQVLPTFYINNLTVEGAVPYETLKNAVEAAWNSSTS